MPRGHAGSSHGGDAATPSVPSVFCSCPIDAAFTVIGHKWSLLILRNLLRGEHRFNEILEHVDGLNPKMLSVRLKELEEGGLVTKLVTATTPVRIEYQLTAKGFAILPILRSMVRWSLEWAPEQVLGKGKTAGDIEKCIEAWQAEILAVQKGIILERGTEVVRVAMKRPDATAPA